ncbi:MAG: thioredoxin domain-containing protein [Aquificaceae bacterium]|nr:thioredoxin domain-containing protein [Aquificaceae bacterium]
MANRLLKAKSPYLQKSAHQPVDWYEWSDEAFQKAREEDKPILLSIGGVWCHWCHVMAHESFENPEIARIINENFIAIKVDRDERPDVDRRYQEVVIALTGSGGWPLTVFLTPDGKAFFGGTYFPPDDRWGRPGFKSLLLRISKLWKEERHRVLKSAESIYESLINYSKQNFKDLIDEALLQKGIYTLLASIDYQFGGVGSAPKFHHAKAFELLIIHDYFNPSDILKKAVILSLDAMAKGGVYDHILGGFFRYSTDEKWHIPHFEKMLYDNAELLSLYSIAYKTLGKNLYKKTAEGILRYYKTYGYDPDGGFYASQDADIGMLDEGGYYTFTEKEIEGLLSPEELRVFALHFGFASMPHEPAKKVLYINMEEEEVAKATGMSPEEVEKLLESGKNKLLHYRQEREMPYIDKTIYTNWNALMISGLCDYWKVFKDEEALRMALKTAERLLRNHYKDGVVYHKEGIEGYSEDYIFLARALLDLFEVTQDRTYLETSRDIMKRAIEFFWDHTDWGFYDSAKGGEGLLSVRLKNLQDTPTQSSNGSAAYTLLLLGALTDDTDFINYGEKTLQAFSRFVKDVPMVSHSYLVSLYAYLKGIYKVETRDFFQEALHLFRPFKFVVKSDVDGLLVCEGQTCQKYENINQILT